MQPTFPSPSPPLTPLRFLPALVAGALASVPHGLLKLSGLGANPSITQSLTIVMSLFAVLHFALVIHTFWIFRHWTPQPIPQSLMPWATLAMSINILTGSMTHLFPVLHQIQHIWLPIWTFFWIFVFWRGIRQSILVIGNAFSSPQNAQQMGFSWMFPVLSMGLIASSGAGLAMQAPSAWLAHIPGLGAVIAAVWGIFLLVTMMPSIIRNQLQAATLPQASMAYSQFNLVPSIGLFGIAFFRWSHYAETWLGWDMASLRNLSVMGSWGFALIYIPFMLFLFRSMLQHDWKHKIFIGNQYALACPLISGSILTAILGHISTAWIGWSWLALSLFSGSLVLFIMIFFRQMRCLVGISHTPGCEAVR